MASGEASGDFDIGWIMEILPHRYPMLLVDRVLEIEAGRRIVALKNVTINEEFFVGHFPGHPVMPGVMMIEGMAQSGGILLLHDRPERAEKLIYFTAIERARFRHPVRPGDQLRYEIEVQHLRKNHGKLGAKAFVGDTLVAEAILSSAMIDR